IHSRARAKPDSSAPLTRYRQSLGPLRLSELQVAFAAQPIVECRTTDEFLGRHFPIVQWVLEQPSLLLVARRGDGVKLAHRPRAWRVLIEILNSRQQERGSVHVATQMSHTNDEVVLRETRQISQNCRCQKQPRQPQWRQGSFDKQM